MASKQLKSYIYEERCHYEIKPFLQSIVITD